MTLKHLNLQHFRNYSKSEFTFSPEINLIVGPNTAGKTNLLEAIYLLATAKSFHAQKEQEMVNWAVEAAHLKGETESVVLEITLTRGEIGGEKVAGKKLKVNGVSKRQIDFIGNLRAVYFGPEDLELVSGSPSLRRHYLDVVLEQVDREYRRANLLYIKGLRARNKLLVKKQEGGSVAPGEMDYWDSLLLTNGPQITQKREEFIEFLNSRDDSRKIIYDKSTISSARLAQYQQEEVAAGVTLVGPQRDDFRIRIYTNENNPNESESNKFEWGRDLGIYGSRGEQRLAILWLKLGELEFISQKSDSRPLLLLDDVFSELDHQNRHQVLKIIPKQQTIITTTDLHLVEEDYQKTAKMIELG